MKVSIGLDPSNATGRNVFKMSFSRPSCTVKVSIGLDPSNATGRNVFKMSLISRS